MNPLHGLDEILFCLFVRERDLIIDDFAFQRRRPILSAKIQDKKRLRWTYERKMSELIQFWKVIQNV